MLALVRSSWNVLRHVFFGCPLLHLPLSRVHDIATFEGRWLGRRSMWPPSRIYALLQYLPIFLSQFSTGLIRLLHGPDMWGVRSRAGIADGKHSTSVQSLLLFSTFHWRKFQQSPTLLYITISLCPCWSLMTTISTACVGILKPPVDVCFCITIARQNTAKVGKTVHIINVLPANSD